MSLYNNDAARDMSKNVPTGMNGYKKAEAEAYVRKITNAYQSALAKTTAELAEANEKIRQFNNTGSSMNTVDEISLKVQLDQANKIIQDQRKELSRNKKEFEETLNQKLQEAKDASDLDAKKADISRINELNRLKSDLDVANAKCESYEQKIHEYEKEGGVLSGFYNQINELEKKSVAQSHKLETTDQYIESLRTRTTASEKACAEYKEKFDTQKKMTDLLVQENEADKETIRLLREEIEKIYKDKLELITSFARS